jgi:hypothetical protein
MIDRLKKYLKRKVKKCINKKYWCKNVAEGGERRALLSYILRPFRPSPSINHTNEVEARLLTSILKDSGYTVDVVDSQFTGRIDYTPYHLILGEGHPLENSFRSDTKIYRIYYATGAGACQRNHSEIERVIEFRRSVNPTVPVYPNRQKEYPDYMSGALSDAIICTGNQFTVDTHRTDSVPVVECVDLPIQEFVAPQWIERDFEQTRTHFVWFGGKGAILKGLDLCVRAFQGVANVTLHLCGPKNEPVFQALSKELKSPNVTYHSFVDPESERFRRIMAECMFSIFPSVSEGGAGSVLTTMTTGTIPVVTEEASLDVEDFGVRIEAPTVEAVRDAVQRCLHLPQQDLADRSKAAYQRIRDYHTVENYKQVVKDVICRVLS